MYLRVDPHAPIPRARTSEVVSRSQINIEGPLYLSEREPWAERQTRCHVPKSGKKWFVFRFFTRKQLLKFKIPAAKWLSQQLFRKKFYAKISMSKFYWKKGLILHKMPPLFKVHVHWIEIQIYIDKRWMVKTTIV